MEKRYLLFDQGNSRLKFRLMNEQGDCIREGIISEENLRAELDHPAFKDPYQVLICASGKMKFHPADYWPGSGIHFFSSTDANSIDWAYPDISQLGTDRMAALLGAKAKFPQRNLIVADAGTCLTVDFLHSDAKHLGGFISPGYRMRLRAMHEFTRALPLPEDDFPEQAMPGTNTVNCMRSGAFSGIIAEIRHHFSNNPFGKNSEFSCILTGGDAQNFAHHLKESTFVAPDLIFTGLFSIRKH